MSPGQRDEKAHRQGGEQKHRQALGKFADAPKDVSAVSVA